MRPLREKRTRSLPCKVNEQDYARVVEISDQEGVRPGEWCRAVVLEAVQKKLQPQPPIEQILLEEFAALRSIVNTLLFEFTTQSPITSERMNQIIAFAEQTKIDRAAKILGQRFKR